MFDLLIESPSSITNSGSNSFGSGLFSDASIPAPVRSRRTGRDPDLCTGRLAAELDLAGEG